ncbi:MAG: hypothetical protein GKR93_05375 [Gammaproteobacteria bacterium]|nr:hypothetical protein [Gammaproteobacteria bacterium]
MSVANLQVQLQSIYELHIEQNVKDFLITCPDMANTLDGGESNSQVKEKLLLRQENDSLDLSLFLDNEVVRKMREDDPVVDMHEGNIEDFCLALEGVSHFLYLLWNASHQRSVTMLEMELQADIDKFVMLVFCFEKQNKRVRPGQIRRILFESAAYHEQLNGLERQRYRDANNFAEKYCWKLEPDFLSNRSRQQVLFELWQFYRLPQADKLRRIQS